MTFFANTVCPYKHKVTGETKTTLENPLLFN